MKRNLIIAVVVALAVVGGVIGYLVVVPYHSVSFTLSDGTVNEAEEFTISASVLHLGSPTWQGGPNFLVYRADDADYIVANPFIVGLAIPSEWYQNESTERTFMIQNQKFYEKQESGTWFDWTNPGFPVTPGIYIIEFYAYGDTGILRVEVL